MQAPASVLLLQTYIINRFLIRLLHVTYKLLGYTSVLHIKQLLHYSGRSFSTAELHASSNWWVTSQNTHHRLLSCTTFTCNLQGIGDILAFYIPNDFSITTDVPFSTVELHASFDWRATPPNTYCNRFLARNFVHTSRKCLDYATGLSIRMGQSMGF